MLRASPLLLREAWEKSQLVSLREMERHEGRQIPKSFCFSKRLLYWVYRLCDHCPFAVLDISFSDSKW